MHIQINTADELTDTDRAILLALVGVTETPSGVLMAEEAKPKKRAARKPKVTDGEIDKAEADAAKVAKHNEEIEKPAESEEPKVDPKELINDAAERAVKLIRAGKRDEVKAILDGLGLEKVTALKDSPEQVQPFLDSISALED